MFQVVFNIISVLQLERLRRESGEELAKMRRDVERSKEEARELALKAEMCRLQTEEEAKKHTLRVSEQLAEMQKQHEREVCGKNAARELIPS